MRKYASQMLGGAVFAVIGAGALVGSIFWFGSTKAFIGRASKAEGRVIELVESRSGSDDSPTYAPRVEFMLPSGERREFTSRTSSDPPSHQEGDKVEVLYDPSAPQKAEINSFVSLWLGVLITGALGVLFLPIGAGMMVAGIRRKKREAWLMANGQRIAASLQGIERVASPTRRRRSGSGLTITTRSENFIISAAAQDPSGRTWQFKSDPLPYDPTAALQGRATVDVLVDPRNYGVYMVDLGSLGPAAPPLAMQ